MPTPVAPAIVTLASCPVPYAILRKDPLTLTGEFGSGWKGTIDFQVKNASDIYTFCGWAGGTPTLVDLGGGTSATRVIPLSHPDIPKLLCTGISAVAAGGYTAGNTEVLKNWSTGRVKLTFTSVPYATDGSAPFLTKETRGSTEEVTLAGVKLHRASDGSTMGADASVKVGRVSYVLTVYMALALDDTSINPLMGCVNSTTFLGWPAGTVLFETWSSSLSLTSTFQQSYTRSLFVTYRSQPWNYALFPDGVWSPVLKPDGSNLYATADLNYLVS